MRDDLVNRCFKKAFPSGTLDYRACWAWPKEDPGKWAPASYLIIYHENGLPNDLDYPDMHKGYRKLEEELGKMFGFKVYLEAHNAAVSTVWKA